MFRRGILDGFLRPENGSGDNDVTNFSKILLIFAIVFKFFDYFCPSSEFSDDYWPTNFFSVFQMDYMTELQRQKIVLEIFLTAKCENFSFEFCTFSFFYMI